MTTPAYLLLAPVSFDQFKLTKKGNRYALLGSLLQKSNGAVLRVTTSRDTLYYVVSPALESLADICAEYDLEGPVVEYTGFYDQNISEEIAA